jgi:hypothetical protein
MRVEADDFADLTRLAVAVGEMTFLQQRSDQVLPDEAAYARNENPHSIRPAKLILISFPTPECRQYQLTERRC